tara:strand:+ start:468 stop:641 length:174 start_codon:yes stop_codon:yes gene_type:complete
MEVFAIIIFGLATVRTLSPFAKPETFKKGTDFIASLIIAGLMMWCYVWFIRLIINVA